MQRTSTLELWREDNEPERPRLIEAIAGERPDFVVLLGDLVFRGDSAREWAECDATLEPLRCQGTPLLPILGNHDYGLRAGPALRHFQARFPHLEGARYFRRDYGPVALLGLDSNRVRMGQTAWDQQTAWYRRELSCLAGDETVRGVVVFVHHPPFTNSAVTGDDLGVRGAFAEPLMRCPKGLAMVSGHVHSYERFTVGGRVFVVSGGGGAPRVPLRRGARLRHTDEVKGPTHRALHYLRVRLGARGLRVEAVPLGDGPTPAACLDAFELPFPGGSRVHP